MTDERWRDSYDNWKLRSPDDEPETDDDDYREQEADREFDDGRFER